MTYTVLARKYRPQTFRDLVGQEHVTRTLENAIATGRVAHAFLFTGVRGVGKTTSARILAKALNCERGPTADPCNECDICKQITAGMDLDVLEMDGASNNSVDDVRRLQESIPFRPARDRFKIVIVDEVHMLSSGAFNAFLKTLEEPPPHVKFIFATTESHKVPVTIRSRCQRYDFRLIPQGVIAQRVSQILASENIQADEHAIAVVAREAAGSMRDALTLLDQVVAFSGDKLVGQEVSHKLGIADREHLYGLCEAVLGGEGKRALEVIDEVATQGLDLLHFTRQWLDLLRDAVVLRVAGDQPKLVELPGEERARALAMSQKHELLELERAFRGVAELVEEVGKSSMPRTSLEMGAVRLATRPPLRDLAQLIARLDALERGGGGGAQAPGPRSPAPGRPGPAAEPPSRGAPAPGGHGHSSAPPPSSARPAAPPGEPAVPASNPFARFVPPEARGALSAAPAGRVEAPSGAAAAAPAVAAVPAVAAAPAVAVAVPPAPAPAPPALRAVPNPAAPPAARPSNAPQENWLAIIRHLRDHEPRWAAMYEHAFPRELSGSRIDVTFPEGSFFGRQAQTPDGTEALRRAARAVFSANPEILISFATQLSGITVAQKEASEVDERKEGLKRKALSHPRVVEALKVFPELGQKQDIQIDPE